MRTKNQISISRKFLNAGMLLIIFMFVFSNDEPLYVYAQENIYCGLDNTIQELSLDGIAFQTCLPFLPDVISSASETDIVQSANILMRTPHHEISIYAIPYGLQPASDILPIAEAGISATYQNLSFDIYKNEAIEYFDSPIIEIFGEKVPGKSVLIPNKIGDPPTGQQLISQWVTEAGERVWIIRLTLTQDNFEDTKTLFESIENISFYSNNLNLPSISKLLSEEVHDQEIPEVVASASDLPFPSWWNGDCNVNNFAGSFPLGGSYRGVKACGPLNSFHLVNFGSGVSQYEWQCAEHSKRYLYLAFNISPYSANGNNIVWNYSGSRLEKITNGTPNKGPNPGDVISYNGPSAAGHTAVVSSANINSSGNGTITIVEQNYSSSGTRTQTVSNWYIVSSDNASGWLHDSQSTGNPLTPPSLQSPNTGQTLDSRSVNFTWQSPGAANQNGYTFRLSTNSNPDTQPWLKDTGLGNEYTSYSHIFSSDGTFYWHMKTWNSSGQASSWVTRSFNINTSSPPPGNWNAKYFGGADHWWDNNNSNNRMCEQNFSSTNLDRNYGSGAPCNNGVNDNWVAEYNATINFPTGSYVFYAQNDDGLKIWVNGSNIMERGGSSGYYPRCPALNLSGNVPIRAILREEGGDARVKITWSTDTSVCIPPGNFNKSSPSNGATGVSTSPTLIWGSSSNSAGYNYCIDTSNNNNCDTGWQSVGSLTSKSLSGLTAGTTYYWQARSNNEGGEVFANNGAWWSFTTQPTAVDNAQFVSQSAYPTVPQGSSLQIFFTIKNTGTTTWQPGSYWLQNLQNPLGANAQQSITQSVAPNSNYTWTINQTAPATLGTYRSQWMISNNGTTFGPNMFIDVTVQTSAVSAPTLKSPANNTTLNRTDSVSLSWNTVSGATQYYAEFSGGPSINVNSGWTANTSWSLGSQWGGSYQWRVKAKNNNGQESAWSETRTLIIKPGTPSNLTPTVLSSDQIALTWSKSSDGPGNLDGYRIYRNGSAVGTIPGSSTTYQNNGLSCGTSYSFFVRAYKGTIESNSSNTINATTHPCPPAVRATNADTRDGNWGLKSSFDPGNPIQWTIHVENTTTANVSVDIGYIVKDPNNTVILNHNQTISASPGTYMWGLPGTVASIGGTYTFTGSVTYQGVKSERTTTYTIVGLPQTLRAILPSNGAQDGWVRESTETSETGGTVDSTAPVLIVGDDASDRQYRSILSFDTSSLPDNAVITQATLAIRVNAIQGGGNPLKMFNYYMADFINGSFEAPAITASDFQASPTVTSGPLGQSNPGGGWLYIGLNTGNTGINPTGLTQVRLRYSLGDNDNGIENTLKFYSGNYATVKHRPQLNVWYYVP